MINKYSLGVDALISTAPDGEIFVNKKKIPYIKSKINNKTIYILPSSIKKQDISSKFTIIETDSPESNISIKPPANKDTTNYKPQKTHSMLGNYQKIQEINRSNSCHLD